MEIGKELKVQTDWNTVVGLDPKGCLELYDQKTVIRGPLKSIEIYRMDFVETDFVKITLKWCVRISLSDLIGVSQRNWEVAQNKPIIFPNLSMPFMVEWTPRKGLQVRFGAMNILYVNPIENLNSF